MSDSVKISIAVGADVTEARQEIEEFLKEISQYKVRLPLSMKQGGDRGDNVEETGDIDRTPLYAGKGNEEFIKINKNLAKTNAFLQELIKKSGSINENNQAANDHDCCDETIEELRKANSISLDIREIVSYLGKDLQKNNQPYQQQQQTTSQNRTTEVIKAPQNDFVDVLILLKELRSINRNTKQFVTSVDKLFGGINIPKAAGASNGRASQSKNKRREIPFDGLFNNVGNLLNAAISILTVAKVSQKILQKINDSSSIFGSAFRHVSSKIFDKGTAVTAETLKKDFFSAKQGDYGGLSTEAKQGLNENTSQSGQSSSNSAERVSGYIEELIKEQQNNSKNLSELNESILDVKLSIDRINALFTKGVPVSRKENESSFTQESNQSFSTQGSDEIETTQSNAFSPKIETKQESIVPVAEKNITSETEIPSANKTKSKTPEKTSKKSPAQPQGLAVPKLSTEPLVPAKKKESEVDNYKKIFNEVLKQSVQTNGETLESFKNAPDKYKPSLEVQEGRVGAEYKTESNKIIVGPELAKRLKEDKLNKSDIELISHELRHAVQAGFGNNKGTDKTVFEGMYKAAAERRGVPISGNKKGVALLDGKTSKEMQRLIKASVDSFIKNNANLIPELAKMTPGITDKSTAKQQEAAVREIIGRLEKDAYLFGKQMVDSGFNLQEKKVINEPIPDPWTESNTETGLKGMTSLSNDLCSCLSPTQDIGLAGFDIDQVDKGFREVLEGVRLDVSEIFDGANFEGSISKGIEGLFEGDFNSSLVKGLGKVFAGKSRNTFTSAIDKGQRITRGYQEASIPNGKQLRLINLLLGRNQGKSQLSYGVQKETSNRSFQSFVDVLGKKNIATANFFADLVGNAAKNFTDTVLDSGTTFNNFAKRSGFSILKTLSEIDPKKAVRGAPGGFIGQAILGKPIRDLIGVVKDNSKFLMDNPTSLKNIGQAVSNVFGEGKNIFNDIIRESPLAPNFIGKAVGNIASQKGIPPAFAKLLELITNKGVLAYRKNVANDPYTALNKGQYTAPAKAIAFDAVLGKVGLPPLVTKALAAIAFTGGLKNKGQEFLNPLSFVSGFKKGFGNNQSGNIFNKVVAGVSAGATEYKAQSIDINDGRLDPSVEFRDVVGETKGFVSEVWAKMQESSLLFASGLALTLSKGITFISSLVTKFLPAKVAVPLNKLLLFVNGLLLSLSAKLQGWASRAIASLNPLSSYSNTQLAQAIEGGNKPTTGQPTAIQSSTNLSNPVSLSQLTPQWATGLGVQNPNRFNTLLGGTQVTQNPQTQGNITLPPSLSGIQNPLSQMGGQTQGSVGSQIPSLSGIQNPLSQTSVQVSSGTAFSASQIPSLSGIQNPLSQVNLSQIPSLSGIQNPLSQQGNSSSGSMPTWMQGIGLPGFTEEDLRIQDTLPIPVNSDDANDLSQTKGSQYKLLPKLIIAMTTGVGVFGKVTNLVVLLLKELYKFIRSFFGKSPQEKMTAGNGSRRLQDRPRDNLGLAGFSSDSWSRSILSIVGDFFTKIVDQIKNLLGIDTQTIAKNISNNEKTEASTDVGLQGFIASQYLNNYSEEELNDGQKIREQLDKKQALETTYKQKQSQYGEDIDSYSLDQLDEMEGLLSEIETSKNFLMAAGYNKVIKSVAAPDQRDIIDPNQQLAADQTREDFNKYTPSGQEEVISAVVGDIYSGLGKAVESGDIFTFPESVIKSRFESEYISAKPSGYTPGGENIVPSEFESYQNPENVPEGQKPSFERLKLGKKVYKTRQIEAEKVFQETGKALQIARQENAAAALRAKAAKEQAQTPQEKEAAKIAAEYSKLKYKELQEAKKAYTSASANRERTTKEYQQKRNNYFLARQNPSLLSTQPQPSVPPTQLTQSAQPTVLQPPTALSTPTGTSSIPSSVPTPSPMSTTELEAQMEIEANRQNQQRPEGVVGAVIAALQKLRKFIISSLNPLFEGKFDIKTILGGGAIVTALVGVFMGVKGKLLSILDGLMSSFGLSSNKGIGGFLNKALVAFGLKNPERTEDEGGIGFNLKSLGGFLLAPLKSVFLPAYLGFQSLMHTFVPAIQNLVQTIESIQPIQNRLDTVGGSKEKGKELFQFAVGVSDETNSSLKGTLESYSKLSSATKNTRLEGAQADKIFSAFSKAFLALGMSGEDAKLSMEAVVQMISKGKISSEELRQQLGEKFPPAMDIFSKALGVSREELINLIESGKVLASTTLPKVADELEKQFSGGAASAANSFVGSMNLIENNLLKIRLAIIDKLGGAFTLVAQVIGKSLTGVTGVITNINNTFNGFLVGFAAFTVTALATVRRSGIGSAIAGEVANFGQSNAIAGALFAGLKPLLMNLRNSLAPFMSGIFTDITGYILNTFAGTNIRNSFQVLNDAFGGIVGVLGNIKTAFINSSDVVSNFGNEVSKSFRNVLNVLQPVMVAMTALGVGSAIIATKVTPIGSAARAITFLVPLITGGAAAVMLFAQSLIGITDAGANGQLDGLAGGFKAIWQSLKPVITSLIEFVSIGVVVGKLFVIFGALSPIFARVAMGIGAIRDRFLAATASARTFGSVARNAFSGLAKSVFTWSNALTLALLTLSESKFGNELISPLNQTVEILEKLGHTLDKLMIDRQLNIKVKTAGRSDTSFGDDINYKKKGIRLDFLGIIEGIFGKAFYTDDILENINSRNKEKRRSSILQRSGLASEQYNINNSTDPRLASLRDYANTRETNASINVNPAVQSSIQLRELNFSKGLSPLEERLNQYKKSLEDLNLKGIIGDAPTLQKPDGSLIEALPNNDVFSKYLESIGMETQSVMELWESALNGNIQSAKQLKQIFGDAVVGLEKEQSKLTGTTKEKTQNTIDALKDYINNFNKVNDNTNKSPKETIEKGIAIIADENSTYQSRAESRSRELAGLPPLETSASPDDVKERVARQISENKTNLTKITGVLTEDNLKSLNLEGLTPDLISNLVSTGQAATANPEDIVSAQGFIANLEKLVNLKGFDSKQLGTDAPKIFDKSSPTSPLNALEKNTEVLSQGRNYGLANQNDGKDLIQNSKSPESLIKNASVLRDTGVITGEELEKIKLFSISEIQKEVLPIVEQRLANPDNRANFLNTNTADIYGEAFKQNLNFLRNSDKGDVSTVGRQEFQRTMDTLQTTQQLTQDRINEFQLPASLFLPGQKLPQGIDKEGLTPFTDFEGTTQSLINPDTTLGRELDAIAEPNKKLQELMAKRASLKEKLAVATSKRDYAERNKINKEIAGLDTELGAQNKNINDKVPFINNFVKSFKSTKDKLEAIKTATINDPEMDDTEKNVYLEEINKALALVDPVLEQLAKSGVTTILGFNEIFEVLAKKIDDANATAETNIATIDTNVAQKQAQLQMFGAGLSKKPIFVQSNISSNKEEIDYQANLVQLTGTKDKIRELTIQQEDQRKFIRGAEGIKNPEQTTLDKIKETKKNLLTISQELYNKQIEWAQQTLDVVVKLFDSARAQLERENVKIDLTYSRKLLENNKKLFFANQGSNPLGNGNFNRTNFTQKDFEESDSRNQVQITREKLIAKKNEIETIYKRYGATQSDGIGKNLSDTDKNKIKVLLNEEAALSNQLIENQIKLRDTLHEKAIRQAKERQSLEDAVSRTAAAALDHQINKLKIRGEIIDSQKNYLQQGQEAAKAKTDAKIGAADTKTTGADKKKELQAIAASPDASPEERAKAEKGLKGLERSGLNLSTNDNIEKGKIDLKIKGLLTEQAIQMQLYRLDRMREQIQARMALKEAEMNKLKAQQAVISAVIEAKRARVEAQKTGDYSGVAIADAEAQTAILGLDIANQQVGNAKDNISLQDKLTELGLETIKNQQKAAKEAEKQGIISNTPQYADLVPKLNRRAKLPKYMEDMNAYFNRRQVQSGNTLNMETLAEVTQKVLSGDFNAIGDLSPKALLNGSNSPKVLPANLDPRITDPSKRIMIENAIRNKQLNGQKVDLTGMDLANKTTQELEDIILTNSNEYQQKSNRPRATDPINSTNPYGNGTAAEKISGIFSATTFEGQLKAIAELMQSVDVRKDKDLQVSPASLYESGNAPIDFSGGVTTNQMNVNAGKINFGNGFDSKNLSTDNQFRSNNLSAKGIVDTLSYLQTPLTQNRTGIEGLNLTAPDGTAIDATFLDSLEQIFKDAIANPFDATKLDTYVQQIQTLHSAGLKPENYGLDAEQFNSNNKSSAISQLIETKDLLTLYPRDPSATGQGNPLINNNVYPQPNVPSAPKSIAEQRFEDIFKAIIEDVKTTSGKPIKGLDFATLQKITPILEVKADKDMPNAVGEYSPDNNKVTIRQSIYDSLSKGTLSKDEFDTLAHEIQHSLQSAFGQVTTTGSMNSSESLLKAVSHNNRGIPLGLKDNPAVKLSSSTNPADIAGANSSTDSYMKGLTPEAIKAYSKGLKNIKATSSLKEREKALREAVFKYELDAQVMARTLSDKAEMGGYPTINDSIGFEKSSPVSPKAVMPAPQNNIVKTGFEGGLPEASFKLGGLDGFGTMGPMLPIDLKPYLQQPTSPNVQNKNVDSNYASNANNKVANISITINNTFDPNTAGQQALLKQVEESQKRTIQKIFYDWGNS